MSRTKSLRHISNIEKLWLAKDSGDDSDAGIPRSVRMSTSGELLLKFDEYLTVLMSFCICQV